MRDPVQFSDLELRVPSIRRSLDWSAQVDGEMSDFRIFYFSLSDGFAVLPAYGLLNNRWRLDQTCHYDDLDRLTGFDATGTSQRYIYDKNGNRSQITFGDVSYAYTLSTTSNRLNATAGPIPNKTNTYDGAGNLTGDGTINYTYGTNGRMETASTAGVTTRYRYNGRGERVLKTSSVDSRHYVYDEQGHLLGEYDAAGAPLQETVYLGDLPVVVMKPGASGPTVYNVYADHLQAPRVLTRASDNQIVWRWDHSDPFGLAQPDENPGGLGTFTYNLRFPGQVFDKETNSHYNYFRDYDPQTGRYVQSDPIGLDGGINTYGYVGGNPLSLVDPDGLQAIPVPTPPITPAPGNSNPGLFPGNPTKLWTDIFSQALTCLHGRCPTGLRRIRCAVRMIARNAKRIATPSTTAVELFVKR